MPNLPRRAFLKAGLGAIAAGAVALAAPRLRSLLDATPPSAAPRQGSPHGVTPPSAEFVIVGGGLAGLVAANRLVDAGREVILLEARDRVGGRVHTFRTRGMHAEAGGEFIDRGHHQMRALIDDLGLKVERTVPRGDEDLDSLVLYRGDVMRAEQLEARAGSGWDRFWSRVDEIAWDIDPNHPLSDDRGLDERSAADLLDQIDPDPVSRFLIEGEIRSAFTSEARQISLLHLATDAAPGADGGEELFRVRGGANQIARRLRDRLGARVITSTPVSRIEAGDARVTIEHAGGTVRADRCVLAVPMPAVRAIAGLPTQLAAAAEGVSYGDAVKTIRRYERRTWRDRDRSGDLSAAAIEIWDATQGQSSEEGLLLGYVPAGFAEAERRRSPQQRADRLTAVFERAERGSARQARTFASFVWGADPYAGGSWLTYAPGEMTAHWKALRRSYGRLHLAGEHTDLFQGYMEGAVRSGRRVAAEILAT